jgi:fructokinase
LDAVAVATVVKLSDDELEFLTGSAQTDAAGSLLHDELRLIAITRGAAGTDYLTHDGQGSVPGFSVAAVDSTGAGDAFVAALLTALCANPDLAADAGALRQALRRANAFAALTVTRHGAIPALPTLSELEAFLDADSDGGDSRFM